MEALIIMLNTHQGFIFDSACLEGYLFDRLVWTEADHETIPLRDVPFISLRHLFSRLGMDANAGDTCDPDRQSSNVAR